MQPPARRSPALLLAIGVCLVALAAAYPVVDERPACASTCGTEFPFVFPPECAACLGPFFNVWNATYQPRIQRIAAYERGYTSSCAVALIALASNQTATNIANYISLQALLNSTTNAINPNVTIGGVTRPVMSHMQLDANTSEPVIPPCVTTFGWLNLDNGVNGYWPPCPGVHPDTYPNVTLTKPEQLAMYFPGMGSNVASNFSAYRSFAQHKARRYLTDPVAAARSLFEDSTQNPWTTTWLFHNVSTADFPRLKGLYGKDWTSTMVLMATAGNLVEYDLTYLEGFTPVPAAWNVAAHVLLEYSRDQATSAPVLTAVAVRLSNVGGGGLSKARKSQVYTVQKSPTAFMLAMSAARSAVATQAIWPGHVYHFHLVQVAAGYALLNTIDPGAPIGHAAHPLRQLLDPLTSPISGAPFIYYVMTLTWNAPHLPSTQNTTAHLLALMELYNRQPPLPGSNDWYDVIPTQLITRSQLSADKFTSAGGEAWDQYPPAKFQLDTLNISTAYATAVVYAYYDSDAAVAADAAVQNFAAALTHPLAGNLGRINPSNQLDTRDKLVELVSWFIAITVLHNTAQINDFGLQLYDLGSLPFTLNINELFSARKRFALEEMVAATQNTEAYRRQVKFANTFQVIQPFGPSLVPSQPGTAPYTPGYQPDYSGVLPFTNNSTAAAVANAATVAFRRGVIQYISSTPYCRKANFTNTPELLAPHFPGLITV